MRIFQKYNPNKKGPVVMIPETMIEWNALMRHQIALGCEIKYEDPGIGMKIVVHASFPSCINDKTGMGIKKTAFIDELREEIDELTRQRDSYINEFKKDVARLTKENKTLENIAESYITRNDVIQKEMTKRGQQYEAELEMVRKQRDEFAEKLKKMESEQNAY